MLRTILLIAIGGAVGSVLRFLASSMISRYWQHSFPLATFIVNSVGCFIIGVLIVKLERNQIINADLRYLLITGFCGGFTTFSAFGAENVALFEQHNPAVALAYIGASVMVGIFAVWLGMQVS